jgi:hypothetical protein
VARRRAGEKAEMFDFGDEAYGEARRYEREAYGLEAAAYWRHVALVVARKNAIIRASTSILRRQVCRAFR